MYPIYALKNLLLYYLNSKNYHLVLYLMSSFLYWDFLCFHLVQEYSPSWRIFYNSCFKSWLFQHLYFILLLASVDYLFLCNSEIFLIHCMPSNFRLFWIFHHSFYEILGLIYILWRVLILVLVVTVLGWLRTHIPTTYLCVWFQCQLHFQSLCSVTQDSSSVLPVGDLCGQSGMGAVVSPIVQFSSGSL